MAKKLQKSDLAPEGKRGRWRRIDIKTTSTADPFLSSLTHGTVHTTTRFRWQECSEEIILTSVQSRTGNNIAGKFLVDIDQNSRICILVELPFQEYHQQERGGGLSEPPQ